MDKNNIIPSGLKTRNGKKLLNTILGTLLNKDFVKDSIKDFIKNTAKKDNKGAVITYNTYINKERRSVGFRAFILTI